jgi:pilus assembly protein Flp/PilA
MMRVLKRLWSEDEGQDLVEYVLLVVVIALTCVAGMTTFAQDINQAFTNAGTNFVGGSGT